ncbi:hypothetical protein HDU96_003398 [Phlyctochytrium bullatum]|nr:hypothetical protein HDU96_003398 [Phlyctochytrium bullatum]
MNNTTVPVPYISPYTPGCGYVNNFIRISRSDVPPRYFNSSNLADGYSVEFSMLQSKICLPNKLIVGLTAANLSYTGLTFFITVFAFIRDFFVVSKGWNDSKSVLILCIGAASSVVLMTIADITGSPTVNSVGWCGATVFICTMEHVTIMSWAKVTINVVGINSKELQKHYENLRFRMFVLSCAVLSALIPIFAVRIALYKFDDPFAYNLTFMVHCLFMMPWFSLFTFTVYSFGSTLTNILETSVKNLAGGDKESSGAGSSNMSSTGAASSNNPSAAASTNNTGGGSNTAAARAEKKRAETMQIAFRVRLVQYGLVVDKLGFIGSYITICTYGFLTLRNTDNGTLAWVSYYGHNLIVLPWVYNWKSVNKPEDSSSSAAPSTTNTVSKGKRDSWA